MIYIKYNGTIAGKESISQLVEEFVDICRINGWGYEIVKENFQSMTARTHITADTAAAGDGTEGSADEEGILALSSSEVYLEGVIIKPSPDKEPVKLTFDRNGRLSTIIFTSSNAPGLTKKISVKKYEFMYFPFVKTITADFEHHVQVVKLLDYVKKRYVKDLEVMDTSSYWETRDDEQLRVKIWKWIKNKHLTI